MEWWTYLLVWLGLQPVFALAWHVFVRSGR